MRITQWLGSLEEWLSVTSLLVMLLIVVWSVSRAEWTTPQPALPLVLFLAVLVGLLLGKSRVPGIVAHPLILVLGAAVTLCQGITLQPV